jgi:bifunctional UDP-N-acetylglucosamine pyrophosphorylase/glucosamine-1-phosphate N-acetyltransferase
MPATPTLIILAGGASSRMWPLREKSLLRFGAEPLLISQLRRYRELGFEDVIIVGNPANVDDIRSLTAGLEGLNVAVTVQTEAKGMGDAILQAAPLLNPDASIYINQVHDVVDMALHQEVLAQHRAHPDHSLIVGYEMADYFPGGYLIVDAEQRITGMVEKPGPQNRPSNLVNIVAHVHSHAGRLLDAIRAEYSRAVPGDDHYERAMDGLMKAHVFRAVPYAGQWRALKFPWHTLDVMDYFLAQIKGQTVAASAYVAPTAVLVGDVFIGEKARVFPGAAVVGPAYIGAGTIVGNNALVRQSMVLDGCNVGFTTEVARSYVADGCQMHACRVLDSIFAPNVNFSAGCTTANLRIDHGSVPSIVKGQKLDTGRDKLGAIIGRDAFLAVDVMTMPGVKIGERAQVGPGTHVHRDVQDGQRIYVKQELVVIDGE